MIAWDVEIEERRLWQLRVLASSQEEAVAIAEESIDEGHHDMEAHGVIATPDPSQFFGPPVPEGYDWFRKELPWWVKA